MLGIDNLATGRRENLARAEARGQAFTFAELDIRDDALLDLFERNQPAVLMRLAARSGVRPSLEDPDRDASISLALGNVDGPRQDPEGEAGVISVFASAMLSGRQPTVFRDGEQTRDYVYVHDTVRAFRLAIDHASRTVVNIGTGIETSVN